MASMLTLIKSIKNVCLPQFLSNMTFT